MEGSLAGLGPWVFWGLTLACFAGLFVLGRTGWPLWARVFAGLLAGAVLGLLFGEVAASAKPVGDAFVKLIRMLIVPLIVTTLMAGVIAMGDPKKLGTLGARTIGLYMTTTVFAVALGILAGLAWRPGAGLSLAAMGSGARGEVTERFEAAAAAERTVVQQLLDVIPANPIAAMANGDILPVIFFSIVLGVAILTAGEAGRPIARGVESLAEAVLRLTGFVMALAPYGVLALMAWVLGTQGLGVILVLGKLAGAVYSGCLIQIVLVYGTLVGVVLRLNPLRFFAGIADAMSTAYSTASSSATLPVTIENVSRLGVHKSVAGSVLPLGATINMDGTSLYLGVVAVFAAQVVGADLTLAQYVGVAATATAASIGAAGIPSASLFLAFAVLQTFGVTTEQAVVIIAFVFPFDRLLDMMRTVTNVTGDAAVATAVAKWEGELDVDVFEGRARGRAAA